MKHTHDDDRLTVGCDACVRRVKADQFWAEWEDVAMNGGDARDLREPVQIALDEFATDERAVKYMDACPESTLFAILMHIGSTDFERAACQHAALRLDGVA